MVQACLPAEERGEKPLVEVYGNQIDLPDETHGVIVPFRHSPSKGIPL